MNRRQVVKGLMLTPLALALTLAGCGKEAPTETKPAAEMTAPAKAGTIGPAEKPDLKFGFIKLTDMAPLAVAYEKRFFEDEGLYVTLEAQANW